VLTGFYRIADICLVTPLRDGMNLVAKEYVAAQDPDDPGVLVLSRFAGAASELPEALLVNPYDVDGVAEAIAAARTMPLEERRARWRAMMDTLERHDISAWRRSYLDALAAA
jgi:trehalose 6-phosphate synthase